MDNSVFISYRRSVSSFIARAVFQDLRAHGLNVFMDVESIDAGQFDNIILNQIAARPYFVLILTPGTLDRCVAPNDWLRREIEHAMSLQRVIVPLLTPEFRFDDARKYLNESLATELQRFNAVSLPHEYFDAAMDKLRQRFLKPEHVLTTPAPSVDESAVQRKMEQATNAPQVTAQQLSAQGYFEHALARPEDDLDGIIADYDEALRLYPDYPEAYRNREQALAHRENNNIPIAKPDAAHSIDNPTPAPPRQSPPKTWWNASSLIQIVITLAIAALVSDIAVGVLESARTYSVTTGDFIGGAVLGVIAALISSIVVSATNRFILKLPLTPTHFIVRGIVGAIFGAFGLWLYYGSPAPSSATYGPWAGWTTFWPVSALPGFIGAVGVKYLQKLILLPFGRKWTE